MTKHDSHYCKPKRITLRLVHQQIDTLIELVCIFDAHHRGVIERIANQLDHLTTQQGTIMSNQEHLDSAVATLTAQFAEVQAEIENLKNQPAAEQLDFTALDAAVQSVSDAVPDAEPAPDDVDPDTGGDVDPA